ncbi:hypothetical protein V2G26_001232 [Clonostachys chloroleuca]
MQNSVSTAPADALAAKAEQKAEKREQRQKKSAIHYPFWFGGSASSMAACVTHPLDLVKVRKNHDGHISEIATPSSPTAKLLKTLNALRTIARTHTYPHLLFLVLENAKLTNFF